MCEILAQKTLVVVLMYREGKDNFDLAFVEVHKFPFSRDMQKLRFVSHAFIRLIRRWVA